MDIRLGGQVLIHQPMTKVIEIVKGMEMERVKEKEMERVKVKDM